MIKSFDESPTIGSVESRAKGVRGRMKWQSEKLMSFDFIWQLALWACLIYFRILGIRFWKANPSILAPWDVIDQKESSSLDGNGISMLCSPRMSLESLRNWDSHSVDSEESESVIESGIREEIEFRETKTSWSSHQVYLAKTTVLAGAVSFEFWFQILDRKDLLYRMKWKSIHLAEKWYPWLLPAIWDQKSRFDTQSIRHCLWSYQVDRSQNVSL